MFLHLSGHSRWGGGGRATPAHWSLISGPWFFSEGSLPSPVTGPVQNPVPRPVRWRGGGGDERGGDEGGERGKGVPLSCGNPLAWTEVPHPNKDRGTTNPGKDRGTLTGQDRDTTLHLHHPG